MSNLRERVALKLRHTYGENTWLALADAAISLVRAEVLEEAAMECERMAKVFAPQQVITDRCAAAIRALKDRRDIS